MKRDQPVLPGSTHQNHIGKDGIAQKSLGQRTGINGRDVLINHRSVNGVQALVAVRAGIGIADEFAYRYLPKADDSLCMFAVSGKRFFGCCHDKITSSA